MPNELDDLAFITTECPECGDVDVPLGEIVLRVCEDDGSARCVVRCPRCGARFSKEAGDGMSVLLVTVGVTVESWSRPAEVDERPRHLAPIRFEEFDRFAAALRDTDDPLSLLTRP